MTMNVIVSIWAVHKHRGIWGLTMDVKLAIWTVTVNTNLPVLAVLLEADLIIPVMAMKEDLAIRPGDCIQYCLIKAICLEFTGEVNEIIDIKSEMIDHFNPMSIQGAEGLMMTQRYRQCLFMSKSIPYSDGLMQNKLKWNLNQNKKMLPLQKIYLKISCAVFQPFVLTSMCSLNTSWFPSDPFYY